MGKRFVIVGEVPSKPNTYRLVSRRGRRTIAKGEAVKDYEMSFALQAGQLRDAGITCPFEIRVKVWFTTMAHDLDNSLKCILDCLQSIGTIPNDNRCLRIVAEKAVDRANPRLELTLYEYEPE